MNRTNKCGKKNENPILHANFLSKLSFWWLCPLFRKGLHTSITEEDLYEYPPALDSTETVNTLIPLWEDEMKRTNPSVIRMLLRAYGSTYIPAMLVFGTIQSCARISQPLFLGKLVTYFAQDGMDESDTTMGKGEAYLSALGLVGCSVITVAFFHPYVFFLYNLTMKIRIGCSGLIYRKSLKMSKSVKNDNLNARAVNIMANDLTKLEYGIRFVHELIEVPIEAIIFGYIMYQEIGISAVIGLAFMLIFVPMQGWGAKKAADFRAKTAALTDARVKLMNEILEGIGAIKMFAWEKCFENIVNIARKKEMKAIRGSTTIYAALASTRIVSKFSIFISLMCYVYLGDAFTARKVFIVSSIFNVMNESLVIFFPLGITYGAEAWVSLRRVQEYILEEEDITRTITNSDCTNENNPKTLNGIFLDKMKFNLVHPNGVNVKSEIVVSGSNGIVLENASTSWQKSSPDGTETNENCSIKNFNVRIVDKCLTAVVGPVGSGKSTFLNVILGELKLTSGTIQVNGTLSYCCQEPWLFEGTVRDNIVFIDEFDKIRYKKVIDACALENDLAVLPHGDSTIVGERGINLSGGQKARVNLARAVYKNADIYLLDDPLSAVDTHVGKHIFEKCIKEFLADKICILVTHQLQYLQNVEQLLLVNGGEIEAQGSYQSLQKLNQFQFLSQTHDESGDTDTKRINTGPIKELDNKKERIQRLNSVIEDKGDDRKELQAAGSVKFSVYKSYFKSLDSCCWFVSVLALLIFCRVCLGGVDYFISRWVNWEESTTNSSFISVIKADYTDSTSLSKYINDETLKKNIIEEIEKERQLLVTIYSALLGTTLILYICRAFGFFYMCLRISLKLHDKLFRAITRAKMYFFHVNPSGRILNRFSQDIYSVDGALPHTLHDCVSFFGDFIAVMVVVCIANYWLLLPAFFMAILFYLLRKFYIETSRAIKRIDAMSRSPMYSHINQTFQGLATIRALQAEKQLEVEFHNCQNANTSAWYLFLATTRAFALWLDLICVVYIAAVTFSFLVLEDQFTSGDVGLAILQCLTLVEASQWGMTQTTALENQMISVERILEYTQLAPEPPLESLPDNRPPNDWPSKGTLEFSNFKLKYEEGGEYILKDLNFQINPNEKIGIVGRTGAGKSSIIQSIFRLAYNEGLIKIDQIDIGTLGLHDLRSKISIIPQDPVLFSGTLRYNLDPFESSEDHDLWRALEEVELKNYVSSIAGGLNCKMSDGGSNFSMGQRQLVCLARAILRNNKILILDEATANVDPETDKLIQKTIRTKFANCTVLTIAHRLHTVMDSDRVLVMDAGRAVEFGHPHELLTKPNGFLRKLVNQTGSQTALALEQIAAKSYKI